MEAERFPEDAGTKEILYVNFWEGRMERGTEGPVSVNCWLFSDERGDGERSGSGIDEIKSLCGGFADNHGVEIKAGG